MVEVVSPNDTASEIDRKVLEYLTAGVRVVWIVYPATRSVTVHLSDRTARKLSGDDVLWASDILDLTTRVSTLFDGLDAFPEARPSQPPPAD